jgi:hypothetical protein
VRWRSSPEHGAAGLPAGPPSCEVLGRSRLLPLSSDGVVSRHFPLSGTPAGVRGGARTHGCRRAISWAGPGRAGASFVAYGL